MRQAICVVLLLCGCPSEAEDGNGDETSTSGETPTSSSTAPSATTDEPPGTTTDDDPSTGPDATGDPDPSSSGGTATVDTGSSDTGEAPLDIIGTYDDNFDGSHEITMDSWVYDSGFGITTTNLQDYSNSEMWVAGEDADLSGTFYRFDWAYEGETLYYCWTVFDATSLQDAIDAPRSDDSDPSTTGCGGMFPWTEMTPT